MNDDCRLIFGDCLDMLPTLSGVDAVVTDPPYGIAHRCNFASRGRGSTCGTRPGTGKPVWNNPRSNDYPDVIGDAEPFDPAPILALNVPTVLWGANHYADKLPASGGWLVWDKMRPDDLDQATCELAWTNCVKGVRRFRHLWNGMMRASEHGKNYHPTQKPIALMAWVLTLPWMPKGTVLDPFMGSGTTGIACLQTGRKFIGIEKDPTYFAVAQKRIADALASPLFDAPTPEPLELFA